MSRIKFSGPNAKASFDWEVEWRTKAGSLVKADPENLEVEYADLVNPFAGQWDPQLRGGYRGD